MSVEGRSVRLTIPARPEYITLGRLALTALAGIRPVSDEALHGSDAVATTTIV